MILPFAIILIILAFVCYTIGVWSEQLSGKLKIWHLFFFWIGFAFDTSSTILMSILSSGFKFNIHYLSGFAALLLMAINAIWASVVLYKKQERLFISFHKFSLIVWFIWLIPFLTGIILNIRLHN